MNNLPPPRFIPLLLLLLLSLRFGILSSSARLDNEEKLSPDVLPDETHDRWSVGEDLGEEGRNGRAHVER